MLLAYVYKTGLEKKNYLDEAPVQLKQIVDKDRIGGCILQWYSPRYKRLIKQIVVDII